MIKTRLFAPLPLLRAPAWRCRRREVRPLGPRALEEQTPWSVLQEFLGATGDDPGHWNYSPEWFGTQNGGWGRDAGRTVFAADSELGHGRVTVTAHECERQEGPPGCLQEWRVLRFNDATRQSIARVTLCPASAPAHSPASSPAGSGGTAAAAAAAAAGGWTLEQQADCLAPEYLKTVASLAAAIIGLQGLLARAGTLAGGGGPSSSGPSSGASSGASSSGFGGGGGGGSRGADWEPLRVLCIGVGGGSLPLFLAHHFPRVLIDAVEIDPVVVAAASQAMGLPASLPNLRLHTADALRFVGDFVAAQQRGGRQRAQQGAGRQGWQQQHYDLVFMDAFDGEDNVPAALCSPEFATALARALHPQHGTLLINMHAEPPKPTLLPGFMLGRTPGPPPEVGYDPETPSGRRIRAAAATFCEALRRSPDAPAAACAGASAAAAGSSSGSGGGGGGQAAGGPAAAGAGAMPAQAFTVSVARQLNVEVVVARGQPLEEDRSLAAVELKAMAGLVAAQAGFRFPAGKRACRGFCEL